MCFIQEIVKQYGVQFLGISILELLPSFQRDQQLEAENFGSLADLTKKGDVVTNFFLLDLKTLGKVPDPSQEMERARRS